MDTPQNFTNTPLSKFEDSPIFNYINSLSPIKPVKSLPIAQSSFQSLSFASLQSIFTSPHVNSNEESKYRQRHNHSDPSKLQSCSENVNKVCSDELQENFNPGMSSKKPSLDMRSEPLDVISQLPQTGYDCGATKSSLVPLVMEGSENAASGAELQLQPIYQVEHKNEVNESDWEKLIADAADLFFLSSPMNSEALKELIQKSPDSNTKSSAPLNELHETQSVTEFPSTQHVETVDPKERQLVLENGDSSVTNMKDTGVVPNLHRGMRRRCLDFETVGGRKKKFDETSSSNSSGSSDIKNDSQSRQLVPFKPRTDSSRCILPGIGLHLNALAITPNNSKHNKHETLPSGISVVRSSNEVNESLTVACTDKGISPIRDIVPIAEDVSLSESYLVSDEPSQNSPRKKRRRAEVEGEACKRCNCKKSKCLKLYCECFAAGVYCIEPCACQDCLNKPIHEETVLATRKQIESRNPLAFAPKVIRCSDPVAEIGDDTSKTPASARHKRGCNCKKSSCLKKYCECYQGGVGCSINCRCEGCKNAFGRKDGSIPMETETVAEGQTEECEDSGIEKFPLITNVQIPEEQNPSAAILATPLRVCGSLVQLPYSSTGSTPRSLISIGPSSACYTNQKYGKPNIIRPPPKVDKPFHAIAEGDVPEILQDNCTPYNGMIKSSSPNSKRVSPPATNFSSSPNRRSGRKLILQSIPSFPSLTQH